VTSIPNTDDRPLRADAAKNRVKILEAAARVFAERGLNATLDEIAEAANVGVATVYRRFPDKDSLVAALFENAIDEITALALQANEIEHSWDGFVWFLEEVLQRQCDNRGLRDLIVGTPYAQEQIGAAKIRIGPAITALVERTQRDGYLRPDLVESDIAVLEMMITSLGGLTNQVAPDLWRRYFAIILDGLVVSRDRPSELPASPTEDRVVAALRASKRLRH
jgi:AcrR family transcriptional regulator